jgi:hypothetical protein
VVDDGNAKMVQGRSPQQQDSHFHLTTKDEFEWPRYLARNIAISKILLADYNMKLTGEGGGGWKINVRERTKDDK